MAFTFKHGDRPLEGYTIQRGIGRGGFGDVYYAISDGGREVALKYLRDNSEIELRGVSHCMNLKSSYLVTIFDVVKNTEGEYFIIMEHVSGPSLRDLLIAESKGVGIEKAAYFVREIGKGLAYLHDRGIVHRDMKPANIFFEEGHVKIGDYGLSKFISVSRHSAQTTSIGTVHYMAPEVGSGNYHRGIDIYALGVMLYEMMLGKVPFEGSSMGEILMKHLTEQPEVSGLPEPFGKVIRKALEKDPRDRYQTVNEMIDDMLEVGAVRDSLAGFNPSTIRAVPRRPVGAEMDSPVPSPNPQRPLPAVPPPGVPSSLDVGRRIPLPPRVERRLRHISERIDRKMDKLAGRRHSPRWTRRAEQAGTPATAGLRPSEQPMGGFKRVALSILLTLGAAIGMGLLVGAGTGRELAGLTTGMMIAGMTLGLRLAPRAARWLGSTAQPPWVEKMVLLGCCAPLMCIATAPATEECGGHAFALTLGMIFTLLVADWNARRESGAGGELSFGSAFSLALCGGLASVAIAGMMDAGHEEHFLMMGAVVGGTLSLLTQALAWFLRTPVATTAGRATTPRGSSDEAAMAGRPGGADLPVAAPIERDRQERLQDIPYALPVEPGTPTGGVALTRPLPRVRSVFERGAFSVLAFIMLFGMVANILLAAIVDYRTSHSSWIPPLPPGLTEEVFFLDMHSFTSVASAHIPLPTLAHIITAIACGSLMLFAAQKLTLRKRRGFWRETLCPFLIAVFMIALGACITVLAAMAPRGEQEAFTIIGIVFSALLLSALLVARIWPLFDRLDALVKDNVEASFIVAGDRGLDQPDKARPGTADPDIETGAHDAEVRA